MPTITHLADETLGEEISRQLDFLSYLSIDDFLLNYDKICAENLRNKQALKLLRCAAISRYKPLIKSGTYLIQRTLKHVITLKTPSSRIDRHLGGGIYSNEVVEIYGAAGCGKTQFALYTAVRSALNTGCHVLYIDTSNCFSVERLGSIITNVDSANASSSGFGATAGGNAREKVLKKISVSQCFDVFSLNDILHHIMQRKKAKEEDDWYNKLKLVIIDNISSLLSSVIGYKSSEGYYVANTLSLQLRRLVRENYIGLLLINGTVGGETTDGLPKPALGMQWQQTADRRLLITEFSESSENKFQLRLVKP